MTYIGWYHEKGDDQAAIEILTVRAPESVEASDDWVDWVINGNLGLVAHV